MHIFKIAWVIAFLAITPIKALGFDRVTDWENFPVGKTFDPNIIDVQRGMQRDVWYSFSEGPIVATISIWDSVLSRINVYQSGEVELREYCRGSRKNIVSSVNSINVLVRRADPIIIDCDGNRSRVTRERFIEILLQHDPILSRKPPRVAVAFAIMTLELYEPNLLRLRPRDRGYDREYDRYDDRERKFNREQDPQLP